MRRGVSTGRESRTTEECRTVPTIPSPHEACSTARAFQAGIGARRHRSRATGRTQTDEALDVPELDRLSLRPLSRRSAEPARADHDRALRTVGMHRSKDIPKLRLTDRPPPRVSLALDDDHLIATLRHEIDSVIALAAHVLNSVPRLQDARSAPLLELFGRQCSKLCPRVERL